MVFGQGMTICRGFLHGIVTPEDKLCGAEKSTDTALDEMVAQVTVIEGIF